MEVNLLDSMGNDLSVVNAARVSFGKRSDKFTDKDAGLIRYLARHKHKSPFNHVSLTFHLRMPLFVHAQFAKHEYIVTNTISRRYVDEPPDFYDVKGWRERASDKKQGSGHELPESDQLACDQMLSHVEQTALYSYEWLLHLGVAPEQARMVLPQHTMTECVSSGFLGAWAKFCRLRLQSDAQKEIHDLAVGIDAMACRVAPVAWAALMSEWGEADVPSDN